MVRGWPWGSSAAWAIWPSGFSAKVRRPSSAQAAHVFGTNLLMFALAYAFRHREGHRGHSAHRADSRLLRHVPHRDDADFSRSFIRFCPSPIPSTPCARPSAALRDGLPARHAAAGTFLFVPPGFAIGLGIGRCDFNLNLMFDEKLGGNRPASGRAGHRQRQSRRADARPIPHAHARPRAAEHRRLPPGSHRPSRGVSTAPTRCCGASAGWRFIAQPLVTFAIMVLVHADVDTRVMMLMAMVVGSSWWTRISS